MISAQAVQHNFPMPRPDVMEQVINDQVPPEMFSELAMYDGSVIVERTKGEMSARCDKEGANLLALNLAHEIVIGELNVEQARQRYAEEIEAMMAGRRGGHRLLPRRPGVRSPRLGDVREVEAHIVV